MKDSSSAVRHDVFLSHDGADKDAVAQIAARLRDDGVSPFLDKWCLVPGARWQDELREALLASQCAAVFFGTGGGGRWRDEELQLALDLAVKTRNDYRVIPVLLPGASEAEVSGFLASRTWVDLRAGLDDADGYQRLLSAVRGEAPPAGGFELPDEPRPYRGLERFEREQHEFFFGRDEATSRLLERLHGDGFVAVVGASGSGKSSLVRAGLFTAAAERAYRGVRRWQRVIVVPGGDPLRSTAERLRRLADKLGVARDPRDAVLWVDQAVARFVERDDGLETMLTGLVDTSTDTVLLIVDQFEELYTLRPSNPEELRVWTERVERFAANLRRLVEARPANVLAVATLRADFVGRFVSESSPHFRALLELRQMWLGSMGEEALREAVVLPAKRRGAFLEKGLVEMILRDMRGQTAAMPLMEEALDVLWTRRRGAWLTVDAYKEIGGVGGALSRKAERIYHDLQPLDRELVRRLLLGLIQLGEGVQDTRRRVVVASLVGAKDDPERLQTLLQRLAAPDARMISLTTLDDGTESAEITHEALIEHWDRLRDWLRDSRDDLRFQRRVQGVASYWEEQGRPTGSLWRPPDLDLLKAFRDRAADAMTHLQLEFLVASEQAEQDRQQERRRQERRLRRFLRFTLVAGTLALVAAVVATYYWDESEIQAELAEQRARQSERLRRTADLATVGDLMLDRARTRSDASTAALLVMEALQQAPDSLQAQLAWAKVLEYYPSPMASWEIPRIASTNAGNIAAFSEDGRYLAISEHGGQNLQVVDLANGQSVFPTGDEVRQVDAVTFDASSSVLVTGNRAGEIHVLNVSDWRELRTLELSEPVQTVAFIGHGRRLAVAGKNGALQIWAVGPWKRTASVGDRAGDTMSVHFSPDGQWIAAMTWHSQIEENVVRIRDLATGYTMGSYIQGDPYALDLSRDGRYLAVNGRFWMRERRRSQVRIYELGFDRSDGQIESTQVEIMPISVRSAALAFDPLGKRLAIGSPEGETRILATRGGRDMAKIDQQGVRRLAFLREGDALAAAGNGRVTVWDFSAGRKLAEELISTGAPLDVERFEREIRDLFPEVEARIGRKLNVEERARHIPAEAE